MFLNRAGHASVFSATTDKGVFSVARQSTKLSLRWILHCPKGIHTFRDISWNVIGENVILRGIFHVVSCFPLHFMLYCGNLDCFSNSIWRNSNINDANESKRLIALLSLTKRNMGIYSVKGWWQCSAWRRGIWGYITFKPGANYYIL